MAMTILHSLILAGGASARMGADKSLFRYHEAPQVSYLAGLLGRHTDEVFVSVRREGIPSLPAGLKLLPDRDEGVGPLEGILGAFERDPEAGWLVVAVDLPFVTEATLKTLMAARDPEVCATAFRNPVDGRPEPVLAIYEPAILPTLRRRKAEGRYSLMLLLDLPHRLVEAGDPRELRNVNTPSDYAAYLAEAAPPAAAPLAEAGGRLAPRLRTRGGAASRPGHGP
jgi:molybdopterin-guanine dinucleotide biosynthesis protein A